MADVVITQDADIGAAIERALGMLPLDDLVRGRLVAVKPNDTTATPQDTTAVTQGDTLRAVLRALKRLQPRHLVASGGAGAAETADVFRYAGMMAAVEQEGVEFFDHNRPPFEQVRLDGALARGAMLPQREVVVNRRVLEYETVVSLAQLKVHDAAVVTLSLKNTGMSFPAADYYGHPRASYLRPHRIFADLHGFIAAMARRFPVHLAIIVGHPAMIDRCPVGGTPVETGLVIASRDPVAADVVGAALLGRTVEQVPHLLEAGRLGLGETDLAKVRFPGLSLEQAARTFKERVRQARRRRRAV